MMYGFVCMLMIVGVIWPVTEAAKGASRGRGGASRSRSRTWGMPVKILNNNSYYGHKDVSLKTISCLFYSSTTWLFYEFLFYPQGAKIIKSSHFELDYMLGRKITFFCMATGFPRPEVTWFKDGIELYHHKFFQVKKKKNKIN